MTTLLSQRHWNNYGLFLVLRDVCISVHYADGISEACYPLPVAMVGLQQTVYQVDEDAGSIEVCVEIQTTSQECIFPSPFGINFTTSDITGTANIII